MNWTLILIATLTVIMGPEKAVDVEALDTGSGSGSAELGHTLSHGGTGMKRDLKRRHVNMIALAGMIVGSIQGPFYFPLCLATFIQC